MPEEKNNTKDKVENEENAKNEIDNQDKINKQNEINALKSKIEEQKHTIDDQDDRIKRLMAEFENTKKRNDKERSNLYNSVMGDVVVKLLPIIDNLEKAVETKTEDEEYKKGVKMCLDQFKDVLKANGVKEIEAVGQKFDPSLHEAVSSVVDENLGEKVIKEEYRKGYMIGDRVIRHSLVVVANKKKIYIFIGGFYYGKDYRY